MDDASRTRSAPPAISSSAGPAFDRWLWVRLREDYDAVLREPPPDALLAMLREDWSGVG